MESILALFWSQRLAFCHCFKQNTAFAVGPEKRAIDKTRIGPDQIRPDRTDKTWIGSNSIKETHIYSSKVGAFQIPTKNGQVVSLDQVDEERLRK